MRNDIVPVSEPFRFVRMRVEGSIISPCSDDCEGDLAI